MSNVATQVHRAAKLMDKEQPNWFRRIVFKRLNMTMPCDCIAGQSGLLWDVMEDKFEERYPKPGVQPFVDAETRPAWIEEIRARRAKASRDAA